MKKTYEKPTLIRRETLSKVAAGSNSPLIIDPNGAIDQNGTGS
ncbi:putative RiPP precursor [Mesorhizobium sp. KR9-304]